MALTQSKHRHLYTTSALSSHTLPCTTTHNFTYCKRYKLIGREEGFPGVPTRPYFALHLLWLLQQIGLAGSNCVYLMHLTSYSVQWHHVGLSKVRNVLMCSGHVETGTYLRDISAPQTNSFLKSPNKT